MRVFDADTVFVGLAVGEVLADAVTEIVGVVEMVGLDVGDGEGTHITVAAMSPVGRKRK